MAESVEAIYQSGVFKPLQPVHLTEDERVRLTVLRMTASEQKPQKLYGDWRGRFPEDFDADAGLKEIRREWLKDLETNGDE